MTRKKILAIDGNSILNRAFYGVKPLTASDGRPTGAVFGFVNIIMKAYESLMPDGVAVAFDLKSPTFRHKKCDFYKANRRSTPDDLLAQFEPVKALCRAFGFHVEEIEGYEADDILGTCAAHAKNGDGGDYDCYILTGDRDSFQLVSDKSFVMLATNNDTVFYDLAKINEVYGLTPEKLIEVKALMGDSSDNIPGVAGIGEKTAIKLIAEYGSVDCLYEKYKSSSLSAGVKAKLESGHDMALTSRFLAEIYTSVPLPLQLDDLTVGERDNAALYDIFSDLELKSFIKRFSLDEATREITVEKAPEKLLEVIDGIPDGKRLFVYPIFDEGIVYMTNDGERVYKTPSDTENLSAVFEGTAHETVLYSSKDVYSHLLNVGICDCNNTCDDLMLLSYVADPAEKHDAEALCERFSSNAIPSGSKDSAPHMCLAMVEICEKLTARVEEIGGMKLYREIELPLAGTLARMEHLGMKLDVEGLRSYGDKIDVRLAERQSNIYAMSGAEFNINSPKQLGEVLFEKLHLPGLKKTKSGFSTDADTLERLRPYHPIVNEILDFRLVSKLRSTYVEGLCTAADKEGGRLHTNFKQAFTLTGRLSSAEPNLQNIPIRKPEGKELRRFFIPEDSSHLLIDADYSQIELRLLAAISGDETMTKAFRDGVDIHTVTASQVFGVPVELVNPELRKKAKAVNFGIVYGISDFALAGDIGTSIKEAGNYIKSYFAKYPKVESYLAETVKKAEEDGYVTTLYGRRRYIPELRSPKKPMQAFGKRVAMNTPIQGTAADIIKIAMIKVEKALADEKIDARLILQVHDELLVEAASDVADVAGEILRREMESAADLAVPLKVELAVGTNWFDAHG